MAGVSRPKVLRYLAAWNLARILARLAHVRTRSVHSYGPPAANRNGRPPRNVGATNVRDSATIARSCNEKVSALRFAEIVGQTSFPIGKLKPEARWWHHLESQG